MAITTKRPALVKRSSGKIVKPKAGKVSGKGMAKTGLSATTARGRETAEQERSEDLGPVDVSIVLPVAETSEADVAAPVAQLVNGADKAANPAAGLAEAQMRTLADLCEALDKKCLELLDDVAAAREAQATSEAAAAELKEAVAKERSRSQGLDRELADARRGQAALEREIASLRLGLERSNRPNVAARKPPEPAAAPKPKPKPKPDRNGEHAARLLPLLQAGLASGKMTAVHDTVRALTRFRVAGMIDAIEGTHEEPVCRGWLLSRTDLQIDPVMFLMDDVGLLGWADADTERPDVTDAYGNTKPLPGFEVRISRIPVGRVRGIVAMAEAGSEGGVVFEAARKTVPKGLFEPARG